MKRRHFLIPSLLAAGFGSHESAPAAAVRTPALGNDDPNAASLMRIFRLDHAYSLAEHRSHRSHSSHSSHRSGSGGHSSHMSHTSHRSSTGGYSVPTYTAPAPSPPPSPPPPPRAAPLHSPALPLRSARTGEASPPKTLSGRSAQFQAIVRRVQIALLAQGYYAGKIDGIVGPAMRAGLRKFQEARGIAVTGTITAEVLDALRISTGD
ncbi:MAG: peptidoglycan-binding protein [Pseudomonadota bacterium]